MQQQQEPLLLVEDGTYVDVTHFVRFELAHNDIRCGVLDLVVQFNYKGQPAQFYLLHFFPVDTVTQNVKPTFPEWTEGICFPPALFFFPRVRTPCGHGAQVIVEGREEQTDGGERNKDPKPTQTKHPKARRPKLHHLVVFPLRWVKRVKRRLMAINGPEFSREKDGSANCVHGKPPRRLQTDFPCQLSVTSGHTTVWQNKVTLQVRCLAMLQRWL